MEQTELEAFTDLGSSCVILRESEARELGLNYDKEKCTCIRGFSNGLVMSRGTAFAQKYAFA